MARTELVKRLDDAMFGDAYLVGFVATTAVYTLAGWGVLWGLLAGVLVGIPALFLIAMVAGMFARDERGLAGRVLGCAVLGVVLGELARQYVGLPGVALGTAAFVYTAVRVWRRDRQVLAGKFVPAALATAKQPEPATVDELVEAAVEKLPSDLDPGLRARVDTALEDYRQLHEILSDTTLVTGVGVDAPGMLAEAQQVLLALLVQTPRVARVQALAARRADDPAARQAADAAVTALGQRAEALHNAASAAVQLAAADAAGDPALLRDHTENLLMLRADTAEANNLRPH